MPFSFISSKQIKQKIRSLLERHQTLLKILIVLSLYFSEQYLHLTRGDEKMQILIQSCITEKLNCVTTLETSKSLSFLFSFYHLSHLLSIDQR